MLYKQNYLDAGNWINDNTFGNAKSATKMDYKGLAYGNLKVGY